MMETRPLLICSFYLQNSESVIQRVWSWVDHPFSIGNFRVSLSSAAVGALTILLAVIISRFLRALLQRRLERKPKVDPGLQYTFLRLLHYIIIVVGLLLAFKSAFNADLTTLAVLFTALSVGIGFGLQYIAGDIAAGFILLFERPVLYSSRNALKNASLNQLAFSPLKIELVTSLSSPSKSQGTIVHSPLDCRHSIWLW